VLVNEILESLAVCFKNCFGEGFKEAANEDFHMEDSQRYELSQDSMNELP